MPAGNMTLLDLAALDAGVAHSIIEESVQIAPELRVVPADIILGSTIPLTVRTDIPTASFRWANEGVARSKSKFEQRVFQCHTLDHQVAVDTKIVADARDPARVLLSHALGAMEAAFRTVSSQFYYGTGNDAKGFPGLISQAKTAATHVHDAGGSTAKSSAWMVRLGMESLEFLFGNGTTIDFDEDWKIETIYDADSNPYQAWTNWMMGNIGLRLANKNSAVRIKNLGTDTGKGLTDDVLYSAYELFTGFGHEPTHIFMNGRSREQLRKSRTATTTDGNPPPIPEQWNGIPIIRTAGITNAE